MKHFVYILYSQKHDRYYVGESSDVKLRMTYHNGANVGGYTSKFRPWLLVLKLEVKDYSTARKIERHIKRQKNRRYTSLLIEDPIFRKQLIDKFSEE